ncbi:MAG TPA: hypothetical protein DIS93_11255 [Bdellovibrionales bacterium]|nr:hypothetical protein [Bdellovibrionales bacterium]
MPRLWRCVCARPALYVTNPDEELAMKKLKRAIIRTFCGTFCILLGAWQAISSEPVRPAAEPIVWLAQIRGTINPASNSYLANAIRSAEADRAEVLVVELDTPGGLLNSVREMVQAIDQSKVPVVFYVAPAGASATSAGAILMLSSHLAAMAPGTNIGAAHPVGPQGEDIKGAMGEKATNDTAAFARSLAEARGRNREIAEEIVSKSKSFTAEEALSKGVIEILAPTREALFKNLSGRTVKFGQPSQGQKIERVLKMEGATVKEAKMTMGQTILNYLANPNIAGLLMTLGVLLIYVELSTPGIGIPGVLGTISILVAFVTFQLLPIRIGGLVLLVVGIGMMIAEPFIVSHGALAAGGIIAFVLGMVWVIDPSSTVLTISPWVWVPAAITLGSMVFLIGFAALKMRKQSQDALEKMGGSGISGLAGYEGTVESIDPEGRSGKVFFRGELWSFTSKEPIEPGDHVKAIEMQGMRVVITRI